MSHVVDLRSDTVTHPTPAMREAMATAEVGDDVYGEDPTVNRLQQVAARLMGMEDALFVPTGTMGNEAAVFAWTRPGDEVLLDEDCHIVKWELGAAAVWSGVQTRTVRNVRGIMALEDLAARIQPGDDHTPRTALLCLETTHNAAGGVVLPLDYMASVAALARSHGIPVHLDGARMFNAAVALRVPANELAKHVDSVMFCLSKGLACPVGSMLCGSHDFVAGARRARRIFGGAMRQVGVLAAPGLVALETMIERLADDHQRARRLAEAINDCAGFAVDMATVQTNMIYLRCDRPSSEVLMGLKTDGILANDLPPHLIRLVTHKDIDDAGIDQAIRSFQHLSVMAPV
jgi:threonine aldolase